MNAGMSQHPPFTIFLCAIICGCTQYQVVFVRCRLQPVGKTMMWWCSSTRNVCKTGKARMLAHSMPRSHLSRFSLPSHVEEKMVRILLFFSQQIELHNKSGNRGAPKERKHAKTRSLCRHDMLIRNNLGSQQSDPQTSYYFFRIHHRLPSLPQIFSLTGRHPIQ